MNIKGAITELFDGMERAVGLMDLKGFNLKTFFYKIKFRTRAWMCSARGLRVINSTRVVMVTSEMAVLRKAYI